MCLGLRARTQQPVIGRTTLRGSLGLRGRNAPEPFRPALAVTSPLGALGFPTKYLQTDVATGPETSYFFR